MAALLPIVGIVILQICLLAWIIGFLRQVVLVQIYKYPPFIPTPTKALAAIADSLHLKPNDVVVELGSGDGRFLLYCARREPSAQYIGIERNPVLLLLSRAKAFLSTDTANVSFVKENIYTYDLTKTTKIYAFLLNSTMDQLLPRLEEGFRGRLASRAFVFQKKNPSETITLSEKKGAYGEHLLHVYDF